MFEDEPPRKPAGAITPGEDLSRLSVAELEDRVETLKREIEHAEAMMKDKRAGIDAAQGLFKTGE